MQYDPGDDLLNLVDEVKRSQRKRVNPNSIPSWENSRYKPIRDLEIDSRGFVGERFVQNCLNQIGYRTQRDEKTSLEEKGYDILVDGHFKLEVKLATRGRTNPTFQHENLKQERDYDAIILIDVAPDKIYMTCGRKKELPFRVKSSKFTVTKKKMHLRPKGEFKWDLHVQDVQRREVKTIDDFERIFNAMYLTSEQ